MRFLEWADARMRHLDVYDVALVKASCLAGGVFLARTVPCLRKIDPRLVGAIALVLAVKPALTALRTQN